MSNLADRVRERIYPVAYAATLAGLDRKTAVRWARGYDFTHKGERRRSPSVLGTAIPNDGADLLSFEELLTLRLVRAFRERGLGLPTIKKAAQVAVGKYGMGNPFVTKAFRTDGRAVFLDLHKQGGLNADEGVLVHALTGQQQFRNVVEPSLFRDVVFVGEVPGEWYPVGLSHGVVIRPDRAFGAPHLRDTGLRTDVIADAVQAEGGDAAAEASVASWFGVEVEKVRDAVAAERQWRQPTAA